LAALLVAVACTLLAGAAVLAPADAAASRGASSAPGAAAQALLGTPVRVEAPAAATLDPAASEESDLTARVAPAARPAAASLPRGSAPVAGAPWLHEPSQQAVDALERASASADVGALLGLVRGEPSLVRHEALRRYLELSGPLALDGLCDLLLEGDPLLVDLLSDAYAAGGTAAHAEALSAILPRLEGDDRPLVAEAVVAIAARGGVSPGALRTAEDALSEQGDPLEGGARRQAQ
jgi:hypothetical protein